MTACGGNEPATCRDGYIALPALPGTPDAGGSRYSCYPPGTTSQITCSKPGAYLSGADCGPPVGALVYVAEPQNYYGAEAECARRGGALASVGSLAEAYGSGWTGDPVEIWIADSAGGSYDTKDTCNTRWMYDTFNPGGCPCINCAGPSTTKPFICRMPSSPTAARAASW